MASKPFLDEAANTINILENPVPGQFREIVSGYAGKMSMSVVNVPLNELTFNPDTLGASVQAGTYKHGLVIKSLNRNYKSVLPGAEEKKEPNKHARGRKPHVSVAPKRKFGKYASLGTTMSIESEIKYRPGEKIDIAGKTIKELYDLPSAYQSDDEDLITVKYTAKIFGNAIQINAKTEDFSSVYRMVLLISSILVKVYDNIPLIPEEFQIVQDTLRMYHEAPMITPTVEELKYITVCEPEVYSRNYHFAHTTSKDYAINLSKLSEYLQKGEDIQDMLDLCGLLSINSTYYAPADNGSHSIRIIHTVICVNKSASTHQIASEISTWGKIKIVYKKNTFWVDVVWRILAFIVQTIKPEFLVKKFDITRKKNMVYPEIDISNEKLLDYWKDDNSDFDEFEEDDSAPFIVPEE